MKITLDKARELLEAMGYEVVEKAEQEHVWYARKDQLQKCVRSTGLCEISPEPRQDRIPLYAALVRTKDLTDSEIADIGTNCGTSMWSLMFARAIIAADRELNGA